MKWITRSHVHVDRVACPWLISRFVDNQAEFLFVPGSQVKKVAADSGAIPFDVADVELTDKNLLFDRKSLNGGKDRVKEKNRPKARVQRVSSGENRTLHGGVLP